VATLLHLIRSDDWRAALSTGAIAPAPEGFVHLSTDEQVAATAGRYYAGITDLHVLAVDEDRTGAEIRWEESRPGEYFPHLYGPLPASAVRAVVPLAHDPSGAFVVPPLPPAAGLAVRSANRADTDDLARLVADAHRQRTGTEPTASQLVGFTAMWDDDTTGALVYEVDGDLAAAVVWTAARTDRGQGAVVAGRSQLSEVVTSPPAWGRGLSSLLLHHVIADLPGEGYEVVELWTQTDNHRARQLYERLGWTLTNALPGVGRAGSPMIQYERALTPHR
jgi:uncharacterized protein (DUF952 family)/GNAT superfamily N-acetyltransferase